METGQSQLAGKLHEVVRGNVIVEQKALEPFSHDQSIYEIRPQAVVFPDDADDIQRLLEFARNEGLPVTARGGGSGTAGGALGDGLVLVLPENEFWSRIDGYSESGSSARVTASAGVYNDKVQQFLNKRGFILPADPGSAAISRIGGNIATKASGPHALRYGSIDRFLEGVEFITTRGESIDTADEKTIPQTIRDGLSELRQRIRADAESCAFLEARKGFKTASGYNLSVLVEDMAMGQRIAHLLTGSVGTLGIVTSATLRALPEESDSVAVLLYFDALAEAGRAVLSLRDLDADAIELISRETMGIIRRRARMPAGSSGPLSMDAHLLLVEMSGPEGRAQAGAMASVLERSGIRMSSPPVIATAGERDEIWKQRKRILWLIEHPEPGLRALAVVNDVGVPPERLPEFIAAAQDIFAKHRVAAFIYGHAGSGNLHLRPLFDMSLPDLQGRVRRLADDVYELVFRFSGTATGEHGMGRLRAPYLRREWGESIYQYMKEVKAIFDPQGLLNPEAMFSERFITDNMRPELLGPPS